MPSSTSNSEPRSPARFVDARVLLALAILLALLEVVARVALVPRSKDLARFRRYPIVAKSLTDAPGYRVALIGNSATDHGIVVDQLDQELGASLGAPAKTEKLVADASKINTWLYMAKRLFWDRGASPDLLVLTFYEHNLQDGNPMEIGRVAQYFTTTGDWPALFSHDLLTIDDRVDFALSSVWATYAFRNRIKERALLSLVPRYKAFASHDADVARKHYGAGAPGGGDVGPSGDDGGAPATYETLDRFLALAASHGTRVCFVAYPTPPDGPGYTIADGLRQHVSARGMPLVDLSKAPSLLAKHYEDDVHLTPEGAVIYTRLVADAIAGPCRAPAVSTR